MTDLALASPHEMAETPKQFERLNMNPV